MAGARPASLASGHWAGGVVGGRSYPGRHHRSARKRGARGGEVCRGRDHRLGRDVRRGGAFDRRHRQPGAAPRRPAARGPAGGPRASARAWPRDLRLDLRRGDPALRLRGGSVGARGARAARRSPPVAGRRLDVSGAGGFDRLRGRGLGGGVAEVRADPGRRAVPAGGAARRIRPASPCISRTASR